MSQKITSKIVCWQDDKGFGFIKSDTKKELFFHISDYRANERLSLETIVSTACETWNNFIKQASVVKSLIYRILSIL